MDVRVSHCRITSTKHEELTIVQIAIAMALDIGLGNESATQAMGGDSEEFKERIRLTWWSIVLLDGISSWSEWSCYFRHSFVLISFPRLWAVQIY